MALYSCVCICPKISRNAFYLQFFTFLLLMLQSTYFICTSWKRKGTMEQQSHRTCEWIKSKQKQNKNKVTPNWPRILQFHLAHKQCNGIIKGWLHYLTSESKERFLVNNILLAWCLVMARLDVKNARKPNITLCPITSQVCLPPPHPFPQSGYHMCITP